MAWAPRCGAIALVLLAFVACDSSEPPPPAPPPSPSPSTPDLVGLPLGQAQAAAKDLGFMLDVAGQWSKKPERLVIDQDPLARSAMQTSAVINVVVSKGYPTIPEVSLRSVEGAKRALRRRGFEVEVVWRNHSPLALLFGNRPSVVATRPPGFHEARPGSVVTLVAYRPTNVNSNANCDPSYPDVCIPPPPPYLNCDDVSYNNIKVVGADPHGFDGYDNDGKGCET